VIEGPTYLGVRVTEEAASAEGGARVTEVIPDSPAARAGVREGDVIVEFDGHLLRGPVGLTLRIQERDPGDTVTLVLLRDGERQTLHVELASRAGEIAVLAPLWNHEHWRERQEEVRERLEELGRRLGEDGDPVLPPEYVDTLWPQLYTPEAWSKPKLGVQLVETTPELRRHLGGSDEAGVLVSKVLRASAAAVAGIAVGDLIVAVDGVPVASPAALVEALADKVGRTFPVEVVRDRRPLTIEVTIPAVEDRPTGPRA
jgi:S1-C subfamily serine protease